jgi:hypothetical protein
MVMEKIPQLNEAELRLRIEQSIQNQRVSTPVVTDISKLHPLYVQFMESVSVEGITIKRIDDNTLQITDLWGVTFQLKKLK